MNEISNNTNRHLDPDNYRDVEGCLSVKNKKNNPISTKLNIIVIFFLFFMILGLQNSKAQDKNFKPVTNTEKVQAELSKLTENTKTIQSTFVQEKHLSFLTENIISKGEFFFKSPDMLRWEYSEPFEYIIVFNHKDIFIKDDQKISRFDTESNKMFSEINNMMIGMIQGDIFKDSEKFDVKYYENADQYLLELEPKLPEMKNMIKYIKIYIDKSDVSVSAIKMVESSDDYTSINFKNRKLNQPIDDGKFKL